MVGGIIIIIIIIVISEHLRELKLCSAVCCMVCSDVFVCYN